MKGRNAKPIEQLKIDGSFIESRHGFATPETTKLDGIPKKPASLTAVGYEYFVAVCTYLIENNMLATADMTVLIRMCQTHEVVVKAQKEMRKGIMIKVKRASGMASEKNPAFQLFKEYSELLLKHEQLFGITPSVRARIKLGKKKEEEDPLDKLIRMQQSA